MESIVTIAEEVSEILTYPVRVSSACESHSFDSCHRKLAAPRR